MSYEDCAYYKYNMNNKKDYCIIYEELVNRWGSENIKYCEGCPYVENYKNRFER